MAKQTKQRQKHSTLLQDAASQMLRPRKKFYLDQDIQYIFMQQQLSSIYFIWSLQNFLIEGLLLVLLQVLVFLSFYVTGHNLPCCS